MQNRYEKLFERLKKEKSKAFIPYTLLGYPDKDTSYKAIEAMILSGASALELGLAFSDPLADGPVIQGAASKTIDSGFTMSQAFEIVKKLRKYHDSIPICLMCYYNSVLALGLRNFAKTLAESGVDAVLVVDLPADESKEFSGFCHEFGIAQVFIISPLTTEIRLQKILNQAAAFLYAVSRLGTTGIEERYDKNLANLIERSKKLSDLPIAVGFGVSTPEQAVQMYKLGADAVITGSRIIEIIERGSIDALSEYVKSMSEAHMSMHV